MDRLGVKDEKLESGPLTRFCFFASLEYTWHRSAIPFSSIVMLLRSMRGSRRAFDTRCCVLHVILRTSFCSRA